MSTKIKSIIFMVFVLLAVGVWYRQGQTPVPAPNAVFKTIKGETLALAELKGKPVLVTFWATDCPACIEEIPQLIALHSQFARQGLTIIAVAMFYDPPNHVLAMAESKQLPYAVALDPNAEHAQAFGNVQFTPATFLIDSNGQVVLQKIGVLDFAELQTLLANI